MDGQIYQLIPKVMREVGAIEKGRKNPQQNYQFRGIDDVYNAVQPALVRNGVFVIPEVMEQTREERKTAKGSALIYTMLKVKHTFYAPDGSNVSAVTIGEAMDSGDKSSNKAMSAAMKYALIEVLAIPTEGDNDTENQTHEVQPVQGEPDERERRRVQMEEVFDSRDFDKRGRAAAMGAACDAYGVSRLGDIGPGEWEEFITHVQSGNYDRYKARQTAAAGA